MGGPFEVNSDPIKTILENNLMLYNTGDSQHTENMKVICTNLVILIWLLFKWKKTTYCTVFSCALCYLNLYPIFETYNRWRVDTLGQCKRSGGGEWNESLITIPKVSFHFKACNTLYIMVLEGSLLSGVPSSEENNQFK